MCKVGAKQNVVAEKTNSIKRRAENFVQGQQER